MQTVNGDILRGEDVQYDKSIFSSINPKCHKPKCHSWKIIEEITVNHFNISMDEILIIYACPQKRVCIYM